MGTKPRSSGQTPQDEAHDECEHESAYHGHKDHDSGPVLAPQGVLEGAGTLLGVVPQTPGELALWGLAMLLICMAICLELALTGHVACTGVFKARFTFRYRRRFAICSEPELPPYNIGRQQSWVRLSGGLGVGLGGLNVGWSLVLGVGLGVGLGGLSVGVSGLSVGVSGLSGLGHRRLFVCTWFVVLLIK